MDKTLLNPAIFASMQHKRCYRQSLADCVWEPQRVAELCRYYYEAHCTILYDRSVCKKAIYFSNGSIKFGYPNVNNVELRTMLNRVALFQ